MRINFAIDFVRINLHNHRKYEKLIVYFNTVVNYLIWKTRNEIKFEFTTFDIKVLVGKIIRSMKARKNVDQKLLENKRIPHLIDLCSCFMLATKKYFPFDNG